MSTNVQALSDIGTMSALPATDFAVFLGMPAEVTAALQRQQRCVVGVMTSSIVGVGVHVQDPDANADAPTVEQIRLHAVLHAARRTAHP